MPIIRLPRRRRAAPARQPGVLAGCWSSLVTCRISQYSREQSPCQQTCPAVGEEPLTRGRQPPGMPRRQAESSTISRNAADPGSMRHRSGPATQTPSTRRIGRSFTRQVGAALTAPPPDLLWTPGNTVPRPSDAVPAAGVQIEPDRHSAELGQSLLQVVAVHHRG